jgi:hypothetical protein
MLNTIIFFLIFFIFVNTKKEYFTDVKRHDQDEILSTNYQIQNYKIEPVKKQNGWDTYWDKKSKVSFKDYSIFNGTKFKNYIKNLDLEISF